MKPARIAALTLIPMIALAGCAGERIVPESDAVSQSSASVPNLDSERIELVLAGVQQTLTEADQAKDTSLFDGRIVAGAARVRGAQYALSKVTGEEVPALDLSPQNLAVTNSQEWPRAVVNITSSDSSTLPVVEFFVQDEARSRYALTSWARLLAGTSLTIPSTSVGSRYVSGESSGFVMTASNAVSRYVEMLNSGSNDLSVFADDEFTRNYLTTVSQLNNSLQASGTVTAQASTVDLPISGVVLQDGSALVSTNFTYTLTYARTIAGSTMRLGGQTAALNEGTEDTVAGTATATYIATLVMLIPSAEAGGVIQIVGGERTIESVTQDGSSNPDTPR